MHYDFVQTIFIILGIVNNELVSNRLSEIRKSLKLTMRDLVAKFNTTSSAISNYENNKFLILSPFLIELAKYSNYSIDWILGINEKYIKQKNGNVLNK